MLGVSAMLGAWLWYFSHCCHLCHHPLWVEFQLLSMMGFSPAEGKCVSMRCVQFPFRYPVLKSHPLRYFLFAPGLTCTAAGSKRTYSPLKTNPSPQNCWQHCQPLSLCRFLVWQFPNRVLNSFKTATEWREKRTQGTCALASSLKVVRVWTLGWGSTWRKCEIQVWFIWTKGERDCCLMTYGVARMPAIMTLKPSKS